VIGVGIDPGLAGAVASLDADGQLRHLHDPPVMAIRVGRQTRQDDDLLAMRRRPVPYAGASCRVCIETQQGRPGQGVSSMVKWGLRYGLWRGIFATLLLPHTLPPPWPGNALWGFWAATRMPAGSAPTPLIPTADPARKQDHGRVEAWYLAYPGLRHPLA